MRSNRSSGLAVLLLSLFVTSASAADLPAPVRYAPVAVAPYTTYNWSGFYVGGQLGYAFEKDHTKEYLTAGGAFTGVEFFYKPSTWIGGVHAGVMQQFNQIVVGAEAEIEAIHARGGFNDPPAPPLNPGGIGTLKRDWQASLRGTIGYAQDRVLVYATGGVAISGFDYFYFNPTAGFGEGEKKTRAGWLVGLGVKYAYTDNIIIGAEYRYVDYGTFDYVAQSAFLGLTGTQSPHMHQLRGSVSYKF